MRLGLGHPIHNAGERTTDQPFGRHGTSVGARPQASLEHDGAVRRIIRLSKSPARFNELNKRVVGVFVQLEPVVVLMSGPCGNRWIEMAK